MRGDASTAEEEPNRRLKGTGKNEMEYDRSSGNFKRKRVVAGNQFLPL